MINIEEVSLSNKENKNILLLNTLTMWEESNLGLEPAQSIEKRKIDNKLKDRYLKISSMDDKSLRIIGSAMIIIGFLLIILFKDIIYFLYYNCLFKLVCQD